jgi:hypothetical protein
MLAPSVKKIPSQIAVKIGIGKMQVPSGEKNLSSFTPFPARPVIVAECRAK